MYKMRKVKIERLKPLPVYSDRFITKIVDGKFIPVQDIIQIAEMYPSNEELMNKINEIIDYING